MEEIIPMQDAEVRTQGKLGALRACAFCIFNFWLLKSRKSGNYDQDHCVTLYDVCGVHEAARHESFLPVRPDHPVPLGVFTVQDGHEFSPFYADVVLISGDERV